MPLPVFYALSCVSALIEALCIPAFVDKFSTKLFKSLRGTLEENSNYSTSGSLQKKHDNRGEAFPVPPSPEGGVNIAASP